MIGLGCTKGIAHIYRLYEKEFQSSIVNLLLYVPSFQIDQLTVYTKVYISLAYYLKASRSQLFSLICVYTFMIFHNFTSFLSHVTKLVQQIH